MGEVSDNTLLLYPVQFGAQMILSNNRGSENCTPLYAHEQTPFTFDTRPPSSFNYVSPNSKLDPSFSFYHFPPTFTVERNNHHDHNHLLVNGHLLPQQQLVTANTSLVTGDMAVSNKKSTVTNSDVDASNPNYSASMATVVKQNLQQKRSVKRDRHSKIVTAQGVRDRRMRLSLEVAPEFFGLQDLRGDDKPSKTIRWLLNQCKGAIKEFARAKELRRKKNCRGRTKSLSSTSDCEVMSEIEETSNSRNHEGMFAGKKVLASKRSKRQALKTKFHHIGRESREKARARARERTIEKIRGRRSEHGAEARPRKMMPTSPSETGEESEVSQSHIIRSSMAMVASLEFQGHNQNTVGEHMETTSKSSASSTFSLQHDIAISQGLIASTNDNHVPRFFENWDIDGTSAYSCYCAMSNPYPSKVNVQDRISSSVFLTTSDIHLPCHLSNVQNFGKPWEVNNY